MKNVAIDLTWLKPGKSGGIEFYSRNLLRGLQEILPEDLHFVVFLSKDNTIISESYSSGFYTFVVCNICANDVWKRIVWLNLNLYSILKKHNIDLCLTPFYSVPLYNKVGMKQIAVIHDLQALHYPQYFSRVKWLWLKFAWKRTLDNCNYVITISNYCKNDILHYYGHKYENKIRVIYNPIDITEKCVEPCNKVNESYFYTICSIFKHKNFETLVRVVAYIKQKQLRLPHVLYVSGMQEFPDKMKKLISELDLDNDIRLTGYISDDQRNYYYLNCKAFLFPSLFEGFGMPVVEAMMFRVPVVTTNMTSIPEVSKGQAVYVDNPFDVEEWIDKIKKVSNDEYETPNFDGSIYSYKLISSQYLAFIREII